MLDIVLAQKPASEAEADINFAGVPRRKQNNVQVKSSTDFVKNDKIQESNHKLASEADFGLTRVERAEEYNIPSKQYRLACEQERTRGIYHLIKLSEQVGHAECQFLAVEGNLRAEVLARKIVSKVKPLLRADTDRFPVKIHQSAREVAIVVAEALLGDGTEQSTPLSGDKVLESQKFEPVLGDLTWQEHFMKNKPEKIKELRARRIKPKVLPYFLKHYRGLQMLDDGSFVPNPDGSVVDYVKLGMTRADLAAYDLPLADELDKFIKRSKPEKFPNMPSIDDILPRMSGKRIYSNQ